MPVTPSSGPVALKVAVRTKADAGKRTGRSTGVSIKHDVVEAL
jgi:hypothetical protein